MAVLRSILSQRRYAVTAIAVFLAFVIVYLMATQFLTFTQRVEPANGFFAVKIADNWQDLMFRARAPFLFEPIGLAYAGNLKLLISVPNMALAALLGVLASLNLTVSYAQFRALGLRGGRGMMSLVGTIPAIVSGAACCVPTLILVVGLQFTATLAAVWPWFVPASIALLVVSLWWSLRKVEKGAS